MKVCTKCLGNKKYRGMGNIMVNCDLCLGVGAIKEAAKSVDEKAEVDAGKMVAVKDPKNLKLTNPDGKKFSDFNPEVDDKPTKNKNGKIKTKSPVIAKEETDAKEAKEARTA